MSQSISEIMSPFRVSRGLLLDKKPIGELCRRALAAVPQNATCACFVCFTVLCFALLSSALLCFDICCVSVFFASCLFALLCIVLLCVELCYVVLLCLYVILCVVIVCVCWSLCLFRLFICVLFYNDFCCSTLFGFA